MMQIRRRYAKTIMASFRRTHLPKWVRFNRYASFQVTLKHGKRSPWKPWHRKRVPLTEKSLTDAIIKIARMTDERGKGYLR